MKPAVENMYFVRGSTDPKIWRFKDAGGVGIVFNDVRLTVNKGDALLFRAAIGTGIVLTDAPNGEVTFTPTTEQTRLVEKGVKCRYEIELRIGALEQVWLMGTVEGIGGDNDDELVP